MVRYGCYWFTLGIVETFPGQHKLRELRELAPHNWASSSAITSGSAGPGAERYRGFIQNVDVFRHHTELADIDFKNPELPLQAECGSSAEAAESSSLV